MNSRQRRKLAAIEHNQYRAEMLERRAGPLPRKRGAGSKLGNKDSALIIAMMAMHV